MTEPAELRRKRLYMRSIRRGIKEMDLILTAFADAKLDTLDDAALDVYERFLNENDHDLYAWTTGQVDCPPHYQALLQDVRSSARGVIRV